MHTAHDTDYWLTSGGGFWAHFPITLSLTDNGNVVALDVFVVDDDQMTENILHQIVAYDLLLEIIDSDATATAISTTAK